MVSFEIFVKVMLPSLSELQVLPSFCFPIKIRDDRTASTLYVLSWYVLIATTEILCTIPTFKKDVKKLPFLVRKIAVRNLLLLCR